jgi:hypothetical protein
MSLTATTILRASCDSVTHLDGQTLPYNYEENAWARDLVQFVADTCALEDAYMFFVYSLTTRLFRHSG